MLEHKTPIFVSYHPDDAEAVKSACEKIKAAGWEIVNGARTETPALPTSELIGQSGMVLVFLSKAFTRDDRLMLEEFAYASVVVRKPFIPVWLDSLADIQTNCMEGACPHAPHPQQRQLLSALEMLTAKHTGINVGGLVTALEQFTPSNPPYTSSTPQICEKPCEAWECLLIDR